MPCPNRKSAGPGRLRRKPFSHLLGHPAIRTTQPVRSATPVTVQKSPSLKGFIGDLITKMMQFYNKALLIG
jgi:hypothetical protein